MSTNQNYDEVSDEDIVLNEENDEMGVIEVFIKCANLAPENRFQLLSTVAYIYAENSLGIVNKYETEVQTCTLTPLFNTTFKVNFNLSTCLRIKIEIWEAGKNKLLGGNLLDIHEIAARSDVIVKELETNGKRNGELLVWGKELKYCNESVFMKWNWKSMVFNKGYFMLRLSRLGGRKVILYQSESKKPPVDWEEFEVNCNRFCKGDDERPVLAEILSLDSGMSVISSAEFKLKQLRKGLDLSTFSSKVKNGVLELENYLYKSGLSFIDIVRQGVEIKPFYIIDFSEKTGHSEENLEKNPYLNCIKSLQDSLQYYSSDPLFIVLGTGGYFSNVSSPSFCFALNGNFFQPEVVGSTLNDYYLATYQSISPSNVTKFSEVLDIVIKYIQHETESLYYYSVFIISAGDPSDINEIDDKLNYISNLPVSVFQLIVNNDLLTYEKVKTIKANTERQLFKYFDSAETNWVLKDLYDQIVKFAEIKEFEIKRFESLKKRNSTILKPAPEKVRMRKNYFTTIKSNFIDHLNQKGYSQDKIEEITRIGVPFMVLGDSSNVNLPARARTKIMGLRNKSVRPLDITCPNCSKIVLFLAELSCGCKVFCSDCSTLTPCPNCQNKS